MPTCPKNIRPSLVLVLVATAFLVACGNSTPPAAPAAKVTAIAAATSTQRAGTTSPTSTAQAGLWLEALLQPQGPTVEATVRVEAATTSASAVLTLTARVPKAGAYPIHLHGGTCRAPGTSVGFLGTLVPGQEGRATFESSGVALPGGTNILTFELLERNEVIIDIHDPGGSVVACAELRRAGQQ